MRRIMQRAWGGALILAALCAPLAFGNQVVGFTLIDADTGAEIRSLEDGDTIDAAQLPTGRVNLRAHTQPPLTGSVRFDLNDRVNQRTDNMVSYVLGGRTAGEDDAVFLPQGEHTLTASPFTRSNALGVKGQTLTIRFTVVGEIGEPPVDPIPTESELAHALAPVALEQAGMVVIEIESHPPMEGWTVLTASPDTLGDAYVWTGPDRFNRPGQGTMTYPFEIHQAGDYELRWRSRISLGEDNTEHNDSWVRLPTGANVPDEWPLEGWTKVYQNQLDQWSWQTTTKDHDPRPIRQRFDAGRHAIQVSGRSHGHAIDRIVLFKYDEIAFDADAFDQAAPSPTLAPAETSASKEAGSDTEHAEENAEAPLEDYEETVEATDAGDNGDA